MADQIKLLPMTRRGDVITAAFLSDVARAVNQLSAGVARGAPVPLTDGQVFSPTLAEDTGVSKTTDARVDLPAASHVWTEYSRYEETVRVSNPDDAEQYVDVGRLRVVQSTNLLGEQEYRVFADGTG